jgi:hypothetical protein
MIRARATREKKAELGPVRAHLDFAARDDPEWSGTTFWRAAVEFYFAEEDAEQTEVVRLLREYLDKEPGDAQARLGVVRARMRDAVPEDYSGLGAEPKGLAELERDVMELVQVSQTAAELHQIAWYFALRHNSVTGLGFVRRSLAADPGCAACMDTLALLLFHAGRPAEALATQVRAMNMTDEEGISEGMWKRYRHYREAARAAGEEEGDRGSSPPPSPEEEK